MVAVGCQVLEVGVRYPICAAQCWVSNMVGMPGIDLMEAGFIVDQESCMSSIREVKFTLSTNLMYVRVLG